MRESAHHVGVETHGGPPLSAAPADAVGADVVTGPCVCLEHVAEVVRHAPDRIERVHAALQDECEPVAPLPPQPLAAEGSDVEAVEGDHAGLEPGWRTQHWRGRIAKRCLAAPGLSDYPDELTLVKLQADVPDRPDPLTPAWLVDDVDAAALQQGHHFSLSRGLESASTPKLISVSETINSTIARPGAKIISHWPGSSAVCCSSAVE